MKNKIKYFLSILLLVSTNFFLFGVTQHIKLNNNLPKINQLNYKDVMFKQYSQEVELNYMQAAKGKTPVPNFYIYETQPDDNLLNIAASCSIPYDTIATLNNILYISENIQNKKLILPTAAGLFICTDPSSDIEFLIQKQYYNKIENNEEDFDYELLGNLFFFLSNKRFTPTVRAFFIDNTIKLPVNHIIISSPYGMRQDPFTGKPKFHGGIDFAIPIGTPVYACKNGTISLCKKNDHIYGNYIVIKHDNGMISIYAHLSKILVKENQVVRGGAKIGLSGSTGKSTGPHLHFEIKENGKTVDPKNILHLQ